MQRIRERLNVIIFGYDTPAGRYFDIALIITIMASIFAVMLESTLPEGAEDAVFLTQLEWVFTIAFTAEYLTRIWVSKDRVGYLFSFYGLVDLISIIPTYLSLFITGSSPLIIIRVLRVLRIFRVMRLLEFSQQARVLTSSLYRIRRRILVFMLSVLVLVTIFGSLMYTIEGPEHGFTSIPKSIYWAIVTITTVGYGDIAPQTELGQIFASLVMISGYAIIAVPTGIVTAEMVSQQQKQFSRKCKVCQNRDHDRDARHCKMCGSQLD